MSHFSGSLNCPPTFETAQGSGPTYGMSPLSSILPVVASPAIAFGVLPAVVVVPAPPLSKTKVLVANLLVFPRGRLVLPKLLLIRGNGQLMIVCSVRGNVLRAARTTSLRPREKALWLMQGEVVM